MKRIKYIVFLFPALLVRAQVLVPTAATAFELQHNFNPEVIRSKNIRKITYEILDKKDFEVPVDKSLTEVYEFNADGLLSRYYYTTIVKTVQKEVMLRTKRNTWEKTLQSEYLYDTISTSYFYRQGNLVLKRYHDGARYYESRYYNYDSAGHLTREKRYKEINNSPDPSVFILGNQVLLSEDSFQYIKYPSGQLKCIFLNNEFRPYKECITNYDSSGHPLDMDETYTAASWIRQQHWFIYRPDGKLQEARFKGNAHHDIVLRTVYEYDEYNELYNEKKYRNEVLLREISYVRDRNNGLLNSFIIRDPSNQSLRIIKLRYDFGSLSRASNKG
ncbi:MAG TPA: hypothetical protein PLQ93_01205 [Bacteroidia bacterium]|nr:hypothetical protein [Bacteroidia bacterium]